MNVVRIFSSRYQSLDIFAYLGVVRQKVVKDVEQGRADGIPLAQLTIFASGLRGSAQRSF